MKSYLAPVRSIVIALIILGVTQKTSAEIVEKIVAVVNDEIITLSDVNKFTERLKSGGLTDELLIPDEATKEAVMKSPDLLLQKLIDEKVMDSHVKKEGLSVTMDRVEQEIRNVAKRNNVSRDELKAALQERGVNFSQYQDFIKTGLERQGLIEKSVTSRIKVSEDDVISALAAAHGGLSDQAYEYTIAHIFFSSKKSGGVNAARTRAEAALKKLKDGGNFDQVASATSEDPNFEDGGMLGVFKSGEMQPELESVVSGLNAGDYTGVLPSRDGFHIVRLVKKHAIPDPRTEKEREKIRASLYEKAYKKQLNSWLELLRQDAFIRINPT